MYKKVIKIKKYRILIFLFFINSIAFTQRCELLFNKAFDAICKNDTSSFLYLLTQYSSECKGGNLTCSSYLLQSIIHQSKGDLDAAIKDLEMGLQEYRVPENLQEISDSCNYVFYNLNEQYIITDYALILQIINIYKKKFNFNEAILYLNKINRKNIPGYSGCLDNMIKIETSIAINYAQCYLALGDTSSAIDRLIDYAIFDKAPESEILIVLLKPLLYKKYSKNEIIKEIDSSIDRIKEVNNISINDFKYTDLEYTLFGRKIPFIFYSLADFKLFLKNNKNLEYIKL